MASKLVFNLLIVKIALSDYTGWDYHDQENWYKNHSECNKDRDESPINIVEVDAIIDTKKCVSRFEWNINETHNRFAVTNNGNILQITPINSDNDKVNNPMAIFPNYFHPTNHDLTYCLDSFHFHWGLGNEFGSEHEINNISYPLEAHFVHYLCHYKNVSEAFKGYHDAKDDHILSVVAILFKISDKDNKALDIILNDNVINDILLPNTTYINTLKLNELIPPIIQLNESGYYYYEGSLTTPPCTDVVRWNIMNVFGEVSNNQMEQLRLLMETANQSLAPNYRDVQYNENDLFGCIKSEENEDIISNDDNAGLSTIDIVLIIICSLLFIISIVAVFLYCRLKKLFGTNSNYQRLELN